MTMPRASKTLVTLVQEYLGLKFPCSSLHSTKTGFPSESTLLSAHRVWLYSSSPTILRTMVSERCLRERSMSVVVAVAAMEVPFIPGHAESKEEAQCDLTKIENREWPHRQGDVTAAEGTADVRGMKQRWNCLCPVRRRGRVPPATASNGMNSSGQRTSFNQWLK
jgi:hypothetical protein